MCGRCRSAAGQAGELIRESAAECRMRCCGSAERRGVLVAETASLADCAIKKDFMLVSG